MQYILVQVLISMCLIATTPRALQSPVNLEIAHANRSIAPTILNNNIALGWLDMLCDQIRFQRVGTPPASRAFGYFGLALHQSIVAGISNGVSLENQLIDLKNIPVPANNQNYDWNIVLNNCEYIVCDEALSRYMSPNSIGLISLRDKFNQQLQQNTSYYIFTASKQLGESLGNAIVNYMKNDGYDYTRENNIYECPSRTGHPEWYEITDIDRSAYEPYWGTLRLLGSLPPDICSTNSATPFSLNPNSEFYKSAMKIVKVDTSLSQYNRVSALYWQDNPIETFTTPGHWMKIAKQQIVERNFNLAQTAEVLTYLGITLMNTSIITWKLKYKVNLLRPETYIHEVLNKPDWQPYQESPPFPEYPSERASCAGAAAEVLTKYFGSTTFIDKTEMLIALKSRTYKSFKEAAEEAAWSSFYGGIDFEAGIKDGLTIGNCIATHTIQTITLIHQ